VLGTRHTDDPTPGGDGVLRAVEEAWVGDRGYARADGGGGGDGAVPAAASRRHRVSHGSDGWQSRAMAFLGEVVTHNGAKILELFVLDLPREAGALREAVGPAAPLQGTHRTRPHPPHGVTQRRLTHTSSRVHPGLSQGGASGPRFWPRSSPCGGAPQKLKT